MGPDFLFFDAFASVLEICMILGYYCYRVSTLRLRGKRRGRSEETTADVPASPSKNQLKQNPVPEQNLLGQFFSIIRTLRGTLDSLLLLVVAPPPLTSSHLVSPAASGTSLNTSFPVSPYSPYGQTLFAISLVVFFLDMIYYSLVLFGIKFW